MRLYYLGPGRVGAAPSALRHASVRAFYWISVESPSLRSLRSGFVCGSTAIVDCDNRGFELTLVAGIENSERGFELTL